MKLIIKIAWRNIMRHRGKSLVIGAILFLGAFLMTIGNGVISGMDRGLQKNIVEGFTGDIVLISDKQESDNVFFEFMGKAVEPVYDFVKVKRVLSEQDCIHSFVPVGKNMVMVLNDVEDGAPGYSSVLGVDFGRYLEVFPDNIIPIEGRLPESGEQGAVIPTGSRKAFFDQMGIWYIPQGEVLRDENLIEEAKENIAELKYSDNIAFMGFSTDNSTSDIRLSIKGIIKYRALNKIWGDFVLMDIESFRQCQGYFTSLDNSVELSDEEKQLLELGSNELEALFSDDALIEDQSEPDVIQNNTEDSFVQTQEKSKTTDIDEGVYNLVLVRLKDGVNKEKSLKSIDAALVKEKLGVKAVPWKKAVGTIGSTAVIVKSALFVFVMLLFFVAIIIIVNTLSMAALERTSEIGMMRAVGARKIFIRMMFLGETGILSFVFGGGGILAGIVIVNIISALKIKSGNDVLQLLFGGDTFSPLLSMPDIGLAVLQLVFVTFIAVLYPLKVAGSITPLDAISRE